MLINRFVRVKGAALFAKRRKRSENWIVDENNVKSISPSLSEPAIVKQSIHQQGTQRAENIQKMNEIQVCIGDFFPVVKYPTSKPKYVSVILT